MFNCPLRNDKQTLKQVVLPGFRVLEHLKLDWWKTSEDIPTILPRLNANWSKIYNALNSQGA